jgi:arachidonate 15-lipoxygenase
MSQLIKKTFGTIERFERIYSFVNFLAKVPVVRRLLISNQYKYDYNVLAPLAMTAVPSSTILKLPKLPQADELPSQKWISLVLNTLVVLVNQQKSTDSLSDLLELVGEEIQEAKEKEELINAILHLKSTLGIEDTQEKREIPGNIKDIAKYLKEELINEPTDITARTGNLANLQKYENLIKPLTIQPKTVNNFQEDKVFAYMQVAGSNPVMLKQIEKIDSRLPITNEQYQNIVSQDSLETALQEGRIYIADYSKLDEIVNGDIGGIQKYIYAPVALFAVPPESDPDRNLLPIAIRCQQTTGEENLIFTPQNGENWMTAKTILQTADSNYHELISHLAQTHLFIEPFVLATNRCFTNKNHIIRLLLKPHLEGTILINYGAHSELLAPKGAVDKLLGGTIESSSQLAIQATLKQLANFNEVAFPKTLGKRGVNDSKKLPIYPYRDDGQRIWDAIHQWVKEYLDLFYSSDESVKTDQQLQNWASELFSKGNCHIGEEADGKIETRNYLVDAISTVIFTASVQHAAVNFAQSGLMTYVPAFPLSCYSPAPTETQPQKNFLELLPKLERTELQIQVLYLLGSVYYTKLGDYSDSYFQDGRVKAALEKFKGKLAEIEQTIENEDQQRLVSYQYLLPSKIPQSINI